MRTVMAGFALAAALASAGAGAQTSVEAVQYPAWLERGGHRVPLTPGTTLQASDTLATGANARVQLRLSEGSTVKLGEHARFAIERIDGRPGVLRAALSVIAGAFRYTGTPVRERDITIRVKNVTAGIRGTDLWGKSTDERDLVCLIEGRIRVQGDGHAAVTLDKPLDFYQLPRGGRPEVAKVDPGQLEEWAKETEFAADGAAARAGGKWRVVAAVFPDRDKALALGRTLRAHGFPTELGSRANQFLVQVPGLVGESEARALMSSLRGITGVSLPHVREGPP